MAIPISTFMTRETKSVAPQTSVAKAYALMREHRIRHLPVVSGGKVIGILSHRDLLKLEARANVDRSLDPVSDAMTPDPYLVPPTEPLVSVVSTMALRKLGSAVVVDGGRPIGIFTTTDALRAFASLLRGEQDHEREAALRAAAID